MNWVHTEMMLLDAATAVVDFATNWLLQSTLLIATGLAVGRFLRRRGSALQSAIYRTTLVAAIACPAMTSLLAQGGVSGWSVHLPKAWTYERLSPLGGNAKPSRAVAFGPPQAPALANGPAPAPLPDNADGIRIALEPERQQASFSNWPASSVGANQVPTGNGQPPVSTFVSDSAPSTRTVPAETWLFQVHAIGLVAIVISLLWLAVSAVMLLRLGCAWWRLDHLRLGAEPAEAPTQQACRELAELLAVCTPEVLRSPYLASPCLAGLLRPAVLLPEANPSLPVRDVLIHELAHLRRRDCFWNVLRRLAESLFFYQPLLWVLSRRLEATAEEVCDDCVVQFGGNREEYARRLLDIAELSAIPVSTAGVAMVSLRSILAQRVARIMDTSRALSTRAGNLLMALVIAGGLAGTLLVGFVGLGPQPSLAEAQPAAAEPGDTVAETARVAETDSVAETKIGDVAKAEGDQSTSDAAETANEQTDGKDGKSDNQLQGRVTGADGKSVAGAKLYWIRSRVHDIQPQPPRLMATTGDEGQFRFTPPPGVSEKDPASWSYTDRIVITAPGHGFKLTSPYEIRRAVDGQDGVFGALARAVTGGRGEPISLPVAGEPIHGRLVDINGQGVAGATLRIRWFNDEDDRRGSLEEAQARGAENAVWKVRLGDLLNVIEPMQLKEVLPSATTDAEGRFELRDIGPQRLVQLLVAGEGIESTEIVARNEPGEKIVIEGDRHEEVESHTVYPNEFLHVVGPSKPVEGRVLDLDTGEPIADAVVRAFVIHGDGLNSSREREHFAARTDDAGRYRITGLPIGDGNRLVAFATGDVAYVPVGHAADTSAAGSAIQQDFRLKRGVWAEGRVFEAKTGKPFTGELTYSFFRDRELEEAIPGLRTAYLDGRYWTNANGEFRVPVLPTRGILAFRYDGQDRDRDGIDRFPRGFGADDIAGSEDLGGARAFPTLPHYLMPSDYERVAEVPPSDGEATVRVEMPLVASEPVTVRVVDDEGQPAVEFQAYGVNERSGWEDREGPQFEVQDLRPDERRKVFVFHRGRNLAGGAFVAQGAQEIVEIKLVKAGSVQGRLVDAEGEPIDDASLFAQYEKLQSGDHTAIWASHPQLSANPTTIPVDKEGRFRLDGLVPGWSYHAHASAPRKFQGEIVDMVIGQPFENVHVEAGETKDLGDLVIDAEKPAATDDTKEEPAPAATKTTAVTGRVSSASGQPASGVHVAVIGMRIQPARGGDLSPRGEVLAEGMTDEDGRYELTLAGVTSKTHANASAIARKEGLGVAWRRINLDAAKIDATFTLPAEELLRGKLIDLEGQPAAGVRLSLEAVSERSENGLSAQVVGYSGGDKVPAAWPPPIISDEQGRFVIRGVPAGHGALLKTEGSDRFAPQDIALNTGAPEQRGEHDGTYRSLVKNVKSAEVAVLPLAPAQWFEGLVRYADSGQPAPHARITIWASQEEFAGSMVAVAGQADDKGRYRINPKPGIRFGLTAYPPDGVPYLARETPHSNALRWETGDRIKQVDLTLPRGVLVQGKIVVAGTEVPVAGAAVQYIPESSNNPNASDDILTGWQGIQLSDLEGRFSIAVLPGPGRLLVNGAQGQFVLQEIGGNQLRYGKPGGERNYAHAIVAINPEAGAESVEVKLELRRGATVTGRIVDQRGEPVEEALVVSRLRISPLSPFWRGHTTPTLGGRFELSGLADDVEYPVYFLDAKRQLGARAMLKAGDGERTVVLRPCGKARLRAVESNAKPVAGYHANVQMVVTPGASRYDVAAARNGELAADADFISNIDRTNHPGLATSDEQGYLTLAALIPEASYQIAVVGDGRIQTVKEFQAKADETLDLGDLIVEPQE